MFSLQSSKLMEAFGFDSTCAPVYSIKIIFNWPHVNRDSTRRPLPPNFRFRPQSDTLDFCKSQRKSPILQEASRVHIVTVKELGLEGLRIHGIHGIQIQACKGL